MGFPLFLSFFYSCFFPYVYLFSSSFVSDARGDLSGLRVAREFVCHELGCVDDIEGVKPITLVATLEYYALDRNGDDDSDGV